MRHVAALAVCTLFSMPGTAAQQPKQSAMETAVREFRVQTRELGLRPDSPRKSTRARRSGNGWHGRLLWNFRNDFLDAVPHEVRQTGGDKSILRRNQYGFNFSGPVYIPKLFYGGNTTFFSVSYEGMRETIGRQYLQTVPTMPERLGDFSQVVDKSGELLPIHDPQSTRLNPDYDPSLAVSRDNLQYLRDTFPGNVMPSARLDPVAMDALQHYPQPNVAIGPFFQNNHSVYSPEVNKADGLRAKLDHALRDRHRVSFGMSVSNGFSGPAAYFETIANPGRPDQDYRVRSGNLEHVFTMSPSSVNTLRFSAWSSVSENLVEDGSGEPFPSFQFSPYLSMGRSYPVSRTARSQMRISDGISFRREKHSLRVSAELERSGVNSFWPTYPSGRFSFKDGLTSLPGIVNTGHAFGSFVLGLSNFAEGSLVQHPSYFRSTQGELNFRDEWELMQGLTVSIGATLSVETPRIEKYDRQSTVDFDAINPENGLPGALIFAGRDGVGRAFQPILVRPEPFLSVAWSPFGDSKTVFRGSARQYYSGIPMHSGQWGTQGFNGTPTYITQNAQLEPAVVLRDGLPPPPNPPPDLRPEAANDTIADLVDRSGRQPRYRYIRMSAERQFPASVVLSVGVNHSRAKNMLAGTNGANPNAISLDALAFRDELNDEDFNRSLRPYPQYQRFDVRSSWPVGRYARDEGYLRVEKRISQGLSFRAVYEYSKQMDDYVGRDGLQDYYDRSKEWSLTYYADPHSLSLSYMYELPFGPNKPLLNAPDWRRHMLEGWMVSGITSYSGGDPITLTAAFNNTGNVVDGLYVNAVPGVDAHVPNQGPDQWFNPDAFINPEDFTIGNVSRAHPSLLNPPRQNHDLSVTKRFPIASDRALEFVGTAFNFLNQADWNRPDSEIGSAGSPNVNAGKIVGSRGGRVVQLGLRFTF